jgi:MFS family permease
VVVMTVTTAAKLWNRSFLAYWLGIALTALGDAFLFVALPFLVLEMTGSATTLANVVLLGTLPRFLGPVTGALADRLHLRLPLIAISLARAAIFAVIGLLALGDTLPIWLISLAAPLNGLLTSFVFAAGMVLVPNLVPREQLARANSMSQAAMMGLPLLGLGLAGALVGSVGVGFTILLATPCLLALALAALFIRFPATASRATRLDVVSDMAAACRYLLASGPLAFLLVMSLVLNLALNLLNVTAPVVMERIGRGAPGYGLFESALSAGILVGIVAVSLLARFVAPRFQISVAQLLMAAGFFLLTLGGFDLYLAGALVLGLGLGFSEVAAVTLLQLAVPDGMRGKVLGIIFTANALGLTLGAWLAGILIESVPVSRIYAAVSVGVLVLTAAWTLLHVRGRETLDRLVRANA